jgi:bifunctional DNA-binding transcriptional regulator/antitoxin component of YhaV-PrlF toxin-antitoxin module
MVKLYVMGDVVVEKSGGLFIPPEVLQKMEIFAGTIVVLEETPNGLLIKPKRDKAFFMKIPELFDKANLPTMEEVLAWKQEDINLEDR